MPTRNRRGRPSKVAKLIENYDLGDIGNDLERMWTSGEGGGSSLRELAAFFNEALLETAISAEGQRPIDGEISNLYRLLTDEEVTRGDRIRAERRLQRQEIDVGDLRDDFVSYQAIRTYLKKVRGVSKDDTGTTRRETARNTVERLLGRAASVAEDRIDQLDEADDIQIGQAQAIIDLRVRCVDCGEQYTLDDLLETGSCDCFSS